MSAAAITHDLADATSTQQENTHAPIRNEDGVRQVTPDHEFPEVKIPVVDDEDEYEVQKDLYLKRVGRAREALKEKEKEEAAAREKKKKEAEAEEAAAREKEKKEAEAEQERLRKEKEAEDDRVRKAAHEEAAQANKKADEATVAKAKDTEGTTGKASRVAPSDNEVAEDNDLMEVDGALDKPQPAVITVAKTKPQSSAKRPSKGKEVDPEEHPMTIGSSGGKRGKPMARVKAKPIEKSKVRPEGSAIVRS